ncbi:MAG TPA: alpha-amylase family glycosyl hydrolase [Candidatus Limnocylindrales bacterium]|jgi:glycosidase|nr:alpha-amylase family glycosyl hydrolase [Candidatus Limnocylindrales bacterium]
MFPLDRVRRGRLAAIGGSIVLLVAACGSAQPSPTGSAAAESPGASDSAPSASVASGSSPACAVPAVRAEPIGPWWADRVFYEVFVRSFQDSDGDGIGDLSGLTNRLDELNDGDPATTADLGVTALWLMPVADSPSYHGYDVDDYEKVEADYGTAADFRALIATAHDRGIAVIVDLVLNHTSRLHPWFQDSITPGSAHDNWYVWSTSKPAFARSDGTAVWHQAGARWYYAYFWEGMPDLNLKNPDVTAALDGVGRFWLDEMGVDGFRLDAARHLIEDGTQLENTPATFDWLAGYRSRVEADRNDAMVLGEVWDATSMASSYVRKGSLDMTFNFDLASATISSLRATRAGFIEGSLAEASTAYPDGGMATFLTNHDQNRVIDQVGGDPAAAKLAGTLLLTGPGVPFIYYGEEIGLGGSKPDEQIRRPMRWDAARPNDGFSEGTPWEPLGDDRPGTDIATEGGDADSILSRYRDLIRLRAAHPALARGGVVVADSTTESVLAFLRTGADETDLIVANLGDSAVVDPMINLAAGPLCGEPTAEWLFGAEGEVAAPRVTATGGFDRYVPVTALGPREAVVIGLHR